MKSPKKKTKFRPLVNSLTPLFLERYPWHYDFTTKPQPAVEPGKVVQFPTKPDSAA